METIDFNEVIRDPETISVVGGLLKVTNAFRPQGTKMPSTFDLNDAKNGIYTLNNNEAYANQPVKAYGVLISFVDDKFYGYQLFAPIENNTILYYRVRGSDTSGWRAWYKFTGIKI